MFASSILDIVTLAIILLIAIWLHEYSHAYVSYKLWDPTPKLQWRLTTNPFKHIDKKDYELRGNENNIKSNNEKLPKEKEDKKK